MIDPLEPINTLLRLPKRELQQLGCETLKSFLTPPILFAQNAADRRFWFTIPLRGRDHRSQILTVLDDSSMEIFDVLPIIFSPDYGAALGRFSDLIEVCVTTLNLPEVLLPEIHNDWIRIEISD